MHTRQPLAENDFKAIVLNQLRKDGVVGEGTVVASEFRLGTTAVRVDLAILGEQFIGVEVKSELDSLKRLKSQARAYGRYFDRVIVAVADRHVRHLDWKSLSSAEVWKVDRSGRVSVAAQPVTVAETRCVSELLTASQLRRHAASASFTEDETLRRKAFEIEFRARYSATTELLWSASSDAPVRAADISKLSRFREVREEFAAWEEQRSIQLNEWLLAVRNLTPPHASSDHSSSTS